MAAVVPNLNSLIKLIGLIDRVDSGLYVPETGVVISAMHSYWGYD